jgi:hypothetical protein
MGWVIIAATNASHTRDTFGDVRKKFEVVLENADNWKQLYLKFQN